MTLPSLKASLVAWTGSTPYPGSCERYRRSSHVGQRHPPVRLAHPTASVYGVKRLAGANGELLRPCRSDHVNRRTVLPQSSTSPAATTAELIEAHTEVASSIASRYRN